MKAKVECENPKCYEGFAGKGNMLLENHAFHPKLCWMLLVQNMKEDLVQFGSL